MILEDLEECGRIDRCSMGVNHARKTEILHGLMIVEQWYFEGERRGMRDARWFYERW